LIDEGVLTEEEYEVSKKEIYSRFEKEYQ